MALKDRLLASTGIMHPMTSAAPTATGSRTLPPLRASSTLPAPRAEDKKDDDEDKEKDKEKSKAEEDDDKKKDDEDDDKKSIARRSSEDGDRADAADPVTRAARDRQRGMMKAVLESEPGKAAFKANPDKVVRFLVGFPGTRQEAISTLELFGADAPKATTTLKERLATAPEVPVAGPGDGEERRRQGNMAKPEDIVRAGKIRRGEVAA